MNEKKIGLILKEARLKKHLTQNQLANYLHVTAQAISKWERGIGLPDVQILMMITDYLGLNMEELLKGQLLIADNTSGNMKKMHFYICPICHNLIFSLTIINTSCCGHKIKEEIIQKELDKDIVKIELVNNEYFITINHPMEKDNYISFIAYITSDTIYVKKLYPEGANYTYFPKAGHGMIIYYSTTRKLKAVLV